MEYKQRQLIKRQPQALSKPKNFSRFLERTIFTPRQANAIDCGVFVCMFILIMAKADENFPTYNEERGQFNQFEPNWGTIFRYIMGYTLFIA